MTTFHTNHHGLILRREVLNLGQTDNHLRKAVADKTVTPVWPGVWLPSTDVPEKPEDLHKLRVWAAVDVDATFKGAPLSHESAGVFHNLSMLEPDLDRVHLSTGRKTGGRREKHRFLHPGIIDDKHLVERDGVTMTSIERTAVDIACAGSFAHALAVFDSALAHRADRDVIELLLKKPRHGIATARAALDHANPLSANAAEAWGRAQMICAGLPIPRLQHKFFDENGAFVAKTDYDWDAVLVAEFDGMVKYARHLRDGETPLDAMKREKRREDKLRSLGIMVVRFIWIDLVRNQMVPVLRRWMVKLNIIDA